METSFNLIKQERAEQIKKHGFSLEKAAALVKSGETVFTCKDALPCLGAFGVEEWISLLVDTKQNITCNLHACATCDINAKGADWQLGDLCRRLGQ